MSKTYDELKRAEQARRTVNVIPAGLRVKGDISGDEDMLVEGIVEGLIQLGEGVLTVGADGQVISDVMAREVAIYGEVQGNVVARDRIEIKRNGMLVGDLATARIIIEEGATFKGAMEVINNGQSNAAPQTAATANQENNRSFAAAG